MLLAALDFSPATEPLLAVAAEEASLRGEPLLLLHVAAPDPDFISMEAGPQPVRDRRADELREEHGKLHALAEELRGRGLEVHARMVEGPTVETILAQAREVGATRIVVATRGQGLLHRMLLGSVSEGVVRGAEVPVLLVPPGRP